MKDLIAELDNYSTAKTDDLMDEQAQVAIKKL